MPPAHATAILILMLLLTGCATRPGTERPRCGDEIVVCGRYFHTGAPVVLWTDPCGYDAYRTEKRFVPWERAAWTPPSQDRARDPATPNRSSIRFAASINTPGCPLSPDDFERIRGGGWDLSTLQRVVDQFVIHYDVCGTSRQCFRILHDVRGLSVHFLLDLDGTIYQTLDLKERAWHATTSNDRSVGIEIANIGAYPPDKLHTLNRWYDPDPDYWFSTGESTMPPDPRSATRVTIPSDLGDGGLRLPGPHHPARNAPVVGTIQGQQLVMYDLTPQQYASLSRLTAALCTIFPNLPCDYPRDDRGHLITDKLSDEKLTNYRGLLGHHHIQNNKIDPGPAFNWDRVITGARR